MASICLKSPGRCKMPFEFVPLAISDLILIKPRAFPDERGFFLETYKESDFRQNGIDVQFKQSNHSCSAAQVLRGLHYQLPPFEQGKLVRVVSGMVWDVAVDMRPDSATFGKWIGVELSGENHHLFWIPGGFAHGFVALTENVHLEYQCTNEFRKDAEGGVRWDDPELGIKWPRQDILVSDKDVILPLFQNATPFPKGYVFGGKS